MQSKQPTSHPDARAVPVYMLPYPDRGAEINLLDLWRVIVARKSLILISLLVAIVLGMAYAFLAQPYYRTETFLLPPRPQDIRELTNVTEILGMEQYTPDRVYQVVLQNLNSRNLRRKFFDIQNLSRQYLDGKSHGENDIDRVFDEKFNDNMRLRRHNQNAASAVVSFGGADPEWTAQRLNQFIVFINQFTVGQLVDDVHSAVEAEIKKVRYQLDSKLKLAVQRRHDEILQLQEALRIARALGIHESRSFAVPAGNNEVSIKVNTALGPLYMRGTKALEAQIAVLESRKSDEPFVDGLSELKQKRTFLENLSVDRGNLSAVTVDSAAKIPYRVERPRKKLIVILAAVLGLLVGFLLLLVAEIRVKARVHLNRHTD